MQADENDFERWFHGHMYLALSRETAIRIYQKEVVERRSNPIHKEDWVIPWPEIPDQLLNS
jgi:hypothetical protein